MKVCVLVCVHVLFYFRVFLDLWDYGVWVCVHVLVCVLVYIRKPGTNLNSSRIAALVLFTLFLRQALSLACGRLGWLARKPRNLPLFLPSTGVTNILYVQWFLLCFSGFQGSNSLLCFHGCNNWVIFMTLYMVIWVCSITQFLKLYYKKSHQIHNGNSCYTIPYVSNPFIEDTVPWTWCFLPVLSYYILAKSVKLIMNAL